MLKKCGFLLLLGALLGLSLAPLRAEEEGHKSGESSGKKDQKSGEEEGAKKAPDGISGGRFAGDPLYVHLAPMVLPIITENGAEQLVTIVIDIQVKDFDTADALHTQMPRVMDTLMRVLYGGLGQGTLRNGKMVDVSKVKAKATAALVQTMGDGITDVLIQGVSQRHL